jgi:prepilin peptidase CpaA
MSWIPTVSLVGVMLVAAVSDLRSRRIPNKLIVIGLALGLTTRALEGWPALGGGLLAAGAALLFGMLLFSVGAMGAGDGKLMAVAGAFLGPELTLVALMTAAVAGGVLSFGIAIRRGVILPVLVRTRDLALWLATFGRRGERTKLDASAGSITFPFGVAIAIGAVSAWFGWIRL